jgi:hypothetical protein
VSLGLLYNQSPPGVRFLNKIIFYRMGLLAPSQPPSWRTRVSLLVWTLPFDLTSMGDPDGSLTTTGIAVWVRVAHKPHHHNKVETPLGGYIYMCLYIIFTFHITINETKFGLLFFHSV